MRNNPFLILIICAFLALTFNLTYFNISTISLLRTTSAEVEIENVQNVNLPFQEAKTYAKAMCLLEQTSHRILYGKNIDLKLPMASTTKIFTALTVLEKCRNVNTLIEIDSRAVGIHGTSIYLRKHERLTIKELLYGMMLPSGNDAATALAYYVGGDIPNFCKLMKETATKAGALNSSFKNPHGLDEDGHYTTAYDLAIASAKVMEYPLFKEIVSTKFIKITGNKEVGNRYLKNKNKLLNNFEGCSGIKTGFTDDAGRCFVGSATRENLGVICSILNCGPMFEECKRLMTSAFEEFKNYEIIPAYNIINSVEVLKGKQSEVKTFSRKSFNYPLTNEEYLKINYEYSMPEFLKAPIKKEQKIGTVKVFLEDKLIFEDEILTMDRIKSNTFFQSLKDFINRW